MEVVEVVKVGEVVGVVEVVEVVETVHAVESVELVEAVEAVDAVEAVADPMVGYWCRVGSLALTHTHSEVAILVQRRTLLSVTCLLVAVRTTRTA